MPEYLWKELHVFLTRWISTDSSDQKRSKWRHILPTLPSAGLTEHCLLCSVLFQALLHIRYEYFDLCIPVTPRLLFSHNSTVPSLVTAEGVTSGSGSELLLHFILIWYSMVTLVKDAFFFPSINCGQGKHPTLQKGRGSILMDSEGTEQVHLSDSWFNRTARGCSVYFTPKLFKMQSPAHFMHLLGSICWESFAELSDGFYHFITRVLFCTISKKHH